MDDDNYYYSQEIFIPTFIHAKNTTEKVIKIRSDAVSTFSSIS